VPFKANQDRHHHSATAISGDELAGVYDAALRQRGSLTVWFSEAAIAAWNAERRSTRGSQPRYSALAIANCTDPARRVPPRSASDRGSDRVDHPSARARARDARSLHLEPASRNPVTAAAGCEHRARASAGRQHRAAAVRSRRMAGREAWSADTVILEEAASWRGRRHRRDHRDHADLPRRR
jgi:hypothetical protein